MAHDGHAIIIESGTAPIKPDKTGLISTRNLKVKNQRDRWKNPLRLAFYYNELMEQGKTKVEIARIEKVSGARVTQVMNLLNLHPDIQRYLNEAKADLNASLFTERELRKITKIQDHDNQLKAFKELIS